MARALHQRARLLLAEEPTAALDVRAEDELLTLLDGLARVGVVHGDAQSLAGWGFDAQALHAVDAAQRYAPWFEQAEVELFASSHTCAAGLAVYGAQSPHAFHPPHAGDRAIVNHGATGMPNRAGDLRGLVSCIALKPSPHPVWAERQAAGAYVALLPVAYDTVAWAADFSAQWLEGSAAILSYGWHLREGA
jgi:hypothetical protein